MMVEDMELPLRSKNNKRRFVSVDFERNLACPNVGVDGSRMDDGEHVYMSNCMHTPFSWSVNSFQCASSGPSLIPLEESNKRSRLEKGSNNSMSSDPSSILSSARSGAHLSVSTESSSQPTVHPRRSSMLSISSTQTEASNSDAPSDQLSGLDLTSITIHSLESSSSSLDGMLISNFSECAQPPSRLDSITHSVEGCSLSSRRAKRRGNIYSTPTSVPPEYFQQFFASVPDLSFSLHGRSET
ncbi:hypothetical protein ACA910_021049 [Epithemia clementina (nom. ined.)]